MIVSKSKQEDIKLRMFFLQQLRMCLPPSTFDNWMEHASARYWYLPITAKFCGEQSKRLDDKIKNHDYSKDETFDEIWQRKVNAGCARNGIPNIYP